MSVNVGCLLSHEMGLLSSVITNATSAAFHNSSFSKIWRSFQNENSPSLALGEACGWGYLYTCITQNKVAVKMTYLGNVYVWLYSIWRGSSGSDSKEYCVVHVDGKILASILWATCVSKLQFWEVVYHNISRLKCIKCLLCKETHTCKYLLLVEL